MSVTVNGRQCQFWSSMYQYNHTLEDDSRFPIDGSATAAKNFCRDPTNKGFPWCYTNDPDVVWEYCSFRPCMNCLYTIHLILALLCTGLGLSVIPYSVII